MNWDLLLPLLITTVVAISGWIVAHNYNAARDLANKRRELRTASLIGAYRALERAAHREGSFSSHADELEAAIADIGLFGNARQIRLAGEFVHQLAQGGTADPGDLLTELRRELRAEFELPLVQPRVASLRISRESSQPV